jgi:hypothetical protein
MGSNYERAGVLSSKYYRKPIFVSANLLPGAALADYSADLRDRPRAPPAKYLRLLEPPLVRLTFRTELNTVPGPNTMALTVVQVPCW